MFGPTPGSKSKIGSSIFQVLRLTLAQQWQAQANIGIPAPIGLIEQWPTSQVPTNRVKCNGASYSRTGTMAALFNVLVQTFTAVFTASSTSVNIPNHNLSITDPVKLFTTGTMPGGFTAGTHGLITAGTVYYVQSVIDANHVTLASAPGGSAISATSAGTGTITAVYAPYGDGDGSTTFTVPDFRGYFFRGWDNGAGVDTNRSLGAVQQDAMQGHFHAITSNNACNNATSAGGAGGSQSGTTTATITIGSPTSDGTNGTPRTAAETRSKNYAANYTIRYQ